VPAQACVFSRSGEDTGSSYCHQAAHEHIGNGRFSAPPKAAVRAFGRIYAGWALSQDFYRANLHLTALKAPDLETFLRTDWEERYSRRHAADLYAQLRTWDAGDISDNALYSGDLTKALNAITAKVLLMPGATDLYFRVADNEAEMQHLRNAELAPIPTNENACRKSAPWRSVGCGEIIKGTSIEARRRTRLP
jgi:homoserine O-acetyltransferase/O-succinyltransferase